jgi:hypothetical protein
LWVGALGKRCWERRRSENMEPISKTDEEENKSRGGWEICLSGFFQIHFDEVFCLEISISTQLFTIPFSISANGWRLWLEGFSFQIPKYNKKVSHFLNNTIPQKSFREGKSGRSQQEWCAPDNNLCNLKFIPTTRFFA